MTTTTSRTNGARRELPTDDGDRRALHAYVTPGGHQAWHGFAAEQGASFSALLQAMADQGLLDVLDTNDPEARRLAKLPAADLMATVVARARTIDATRRRRVR